MKIIITESQSKKLMEDDVKISPNKNDLPKHVSDLEKIVGELKKNVAKLYNFCLDLNMRSILDQENNYKELIETQRFNSKRYTKYYNTYYDIIELYWDDYLNDNMDQETYGLYKRAESLVDELDSANLDYEDLIDYMDEIYEKADSSKFKNLLNKYPDTTIQITPKN